MFLFQRQDEKEESCFNMELTAHILLVSQKAGWAFLLKKRLRRFMLLDIYSIYKYMHICLISTYTCSQEAFKEHLETITQTSEVWMHVFEMRI